MSPDDYDRLRVHNWSYQEDIKRGTGYAYRTSKKSEGARRKIYMHRDITQAPTGKVVDHANRDGLDNQRPNLRVTTHKFNTANCAPYGALGLKGVSYVAPFRYRARICIDEVDVHLGYFRTPEEAAAAYDIAALTHFGPFAWINSERTAYPVEAARALTGPPAAFLPARDVPFELEVTGDPWGWGSGDGAGSDVAGRTLVPMLAVA